MQGACVNERRTTSRPAGALRIALLAMGLQCCPPWALAQEVAASGSLATIERIEALTAQDSVEARLLGEQTLRAATAGDDIELQARAHLALGRIDLIEGRFAAAIVRFEQALALDPQGPALRARILTYLGTTLDRSGLSVDAIAPQQEALQLYLEQGNWQDASAVLANLGNAYSGQDDGEAAREHYQRALALKREHGITRGVGSVLNNLADLSVVAGEHEEAAARLRESIAASSAPEDTGARGVALANLAIALARLGRFDEALAQVDGAIAIADELNDNGRRLGALRARAEVLLTQARAAAPASSERALALREAAALLRPAIEQTAQAGDPMRQLQMTELLADVREAQGASAEALSLLRAAQAQRRELDRRSQNERREAASARFEYAKQSSELALLRQRDSARAKELRDRDRVTIALGVAALCLFGIAILVLRRLRERRRFEDTLEQRNTALATALDEAQAQRRRSDAYATSHRQLLRLASEDLRAPLSEIRADAERLLVEHGDAEQRGRRVASIARTAADLLWVSDQMLESARHPDFAAPLDPQPATSLRPLLQDLLDEAGVHALRHQQELQFDADHDVEMPFDPQRLRAVLHELIELVLRASPAQTCFTVRLEATPEAARILIDDPAGVAPDWRSVASDRSARGRVPRLGFAWVAQTLAALGGSTNTVTRGSPPLRVIAIELPRAPRLPRDAAD